MTRLDLGILIFKVEKGYAEFNHYIDSSKRELKKLVYLQVDLEKGRYWIVPVAFNHWGLQESRNTSYPKYVLT